LPSPIQNHAGDGNRLICCALANPLMILLSRNPTDRPGSRLTGRLVFFVCRGSNVATRQVDESAPLID
jgi:hypothetical protein